MGFREFIAETARLATVQGLDDWYYKEFPYVIEVQADGIAAEGLGQPSPAWFVFPMAPQEYSVKRVFRQSVTPTLGGITAEEAGLLWREIHVAGTFGLEPKEADDKTAAPDRPLAREKLSGPGWTRRMIRNIFEKYAELKSNPEYAPLVRMIWHDMKTDEHYVVVPETVDIPRTVAKRFQYPYTLVLKGIAKADTIVLPDSASSLSGFAKLKNAIVAVDRGLALVNSAIQEGSAYLGEVRFFADQVDSVLDNVTVIASSAQDFVDGVTDTISVGTVFINTASASLEAVLITLETATSLPDAVRQNYAMALDGLDAIAAQAAVYGRTYDQVFDGVESSEAGAARDSAATLSSAATSGAPESAAEAASNRERSSDAALVAAGAINSPRLRGSYTGYREYAVNAGDTMASIAAQFLGDGSLWYDIALINGLKPPFTSAARIPGTVSTGDVIAIPVSATDPTTAVVSGSGAQTGADLLGVDIALFEDSNSIPGRPVVDMQVDARTGTDVALVRGIDCLKQDLQLRMWTERGTMPLVPNYGFPRSVGIKQTGAALALLRLGAQGTIRQDSRVKSIAAVRFEVASDLIEIDMDVVPIGANNAQSVTLSVV